MRGILICCLWSQLLWWTCSWRNVHPKYALRSHSLLHNTHRIATSLQQNINNEVDIEVLDTADFAGKKCNSMMTTSSAGRGWFPVLATEAVDTSLPISIEIAGEKYVAWQNPQEIHTNSIRKGWSVMIDACPHRLAPLSEGRVDSMTGCLECPYHGWQFEGTTGQCSKIPQRSEPLPSKLAQASTTAQSFPVHLTAGLLWAYLPMLHSNQSYDALPETIIPELIDPTRSGVVSRELPYSFDFTIENFMDPAHIPFAHHSLQGVREDGSPIPMTILTNIQHNHTHLEIEFYDKIRNKSRDGIVSFVAPCYYHFRTRNTKVPGSTEYTKNLIILVVPIAPGRSRIFLSVKLPNSWIFQRFPKWIMHGFSMKFLDSDLWIHDQERLLRAPRNSFESPLTASENMVSDTANGDSLLREYSLMSTSDKGCIAWRKWWSLHMAHSPIFGFGKSHLNLPSISKEEQRNHFTSHSKDCKHCLKALKHANNIEAVISPVVSLALLTIGMMKVVTNVNRNLRGKAWVWAAIAVFSSSSTLLAGKGFASYVKKFVVGPDASDKVSAAQFPLKKTNKTKK